MKTLQHIAAAAIAALWLAACASAPSPQPEPQAQRYSGVLLQWFEGQSFTADGESQAWAVGATREAWSQMATAFPQDYRPAPASPTRIVLDAEGVLRPANPDAARYGPIGNYQHYLTITRVHQARLLRSACESAPARVYFDTNQAALSPQALEVIAQTLQEAQRQACNVTRVRIVGHTDAVGSAHANLALSEARALAVRDALTARGLDAALAEIEAAGETQPLRHTRDGAAEPINRAVEITFEAPADETR